VIIISSLVKEKAKQKKNKNKMLQLRNDLLQSDHFCSSNININYDQSDSSQVGPLFWNSYMVTSPKLNTLNSTHKVHRYVSTSHLLRCSELCR